MPQRRGRVRTSARVRENPGVLIAVAERGSLPPLAGRAHPSGEPALLDLAGAADRGSLPWGTRSPRLQGLVMLHFTVGAAIAPLPWCNLAPLDLSPCSGSAHAFPTRQGRHGCCSCSSRDRQRTRTATGKPLAESGKLISPCAVSR